MEDGVEMLTNITAAVIILKVSTYTCMLLRYHTYYHCLLFPLVFHNSLIMVLLPLVVVTGVILVLIMTIIIVVIVIMKRTGLSNLYSLLASIVIFAIIIGSCTRKLKV
jgi:hypothetical protein